MKPAYLILDEATAMLDPAGRREVLDIVQRLNRAGTTVVSITHHVTEALAASRVAILDGGRLLDVGSPRAILIKEERLRAAGLEAPPVVRLVQELRRRGVGVPAGVISPIELADWMAHLRKGPAL